MRLCMYGQARCLLAVLVTSRKKRLCPRSATRDGCRYGSASQGMRHQGMRHQIANMTPFSTASPPVELFTFSLQVEGPCRIAECVDSQFLASGCSFKGPMQLGGSSFDSSSSTSGGSSSSSGGGGCGGDGSSGSSTSGGGGRGRKGSSSNNTGSAVTEKTKMGAYVGLTFHAPTAMDASRPPGSKPFSMLLSKCSFQGYMDCVWVSRLGAVTGWLVGLAVGLPAVEVQLPGLHGLRPGEFEWVSGTSGHLVVSAARGRCGSGGLRVGWGC